MEELSDRHQELPKDKKIVLQCLFGKQGYNGSQISAVKRV
jgi:hypothetical protein